MEDSRTRAIAYCDQVKAKYFDQIRYSVDIAGGTDYTQQVRALAFKPDGTRMFIGEKNSDRIREYILTIPFDLTSGVSLGSRSAALTSADNNMRNIQFNFSFIIT